MIEVPSILGEGLQYFISQWYDIINHTRLYLSHTPPKVLVTGRLRRWH